MIAEYYIEELSEWYRVIGFYNSEMNEIESRLTEVIQRNTIPNIAARTEAELNKLNVISGKFNQLLLYIQQQEAALKTDSIVIEDSQIKLETEKMQNQVRHQMREAEKEYLDVKYACNNFLLDIIKKHDNDQTK
jgi:hypothetical protein